jgi:hypothetical protein
MDINRIQQSIIGACVGENQFARVKWLLTNDFDPMYREVWKSILSSSGSLYECYKSKLVYHCVCISDYTFIDRLGLILLEHRFKQYAQDILTDMILKCDDVAVVLVLQKAMEESEKIDILELIDYLPEYISTFTDAKRLIDLKDYVDGRAKTIREA